MAADQIDNATDLQTLLNASSLQAQLATSNFSRASKAWCECGAKIPPARQKLGGVTLCVDCQTDLEKQQQR